MKSFSILLCSLLLSGADAFQPARRPTTAPGVAILTHQKMVGIGTTRISQTSSTTSLCSSISPEQDDEIFAPMQESQISWVDLPTSQKRVEASDSIEIVAGRIAMVTSLGLIAGEVFNGKSVPEQVLCALHIIN